MFHHSPPLHVVYTPPQTLHKLQQSHTVSVPFSPIGIESTTNSHSNYHHAPIHRALPDTPPNARNKRQNASETMQKILTDHDNNDNNSCISPSLLSVASPVSISSSLNIASPTDSNINGYDIDDHKKHEQIMDKTTTNNEYNDNDGNNDKQNMSSTSYSSCNDDKQHSFSSYMYSMYEMEEKQDIKIEKKKKRFPLHSECDENVSIEDFICNDRLKRSIGIYFDKYCIKKSNNYQFNRYSLLSSKGLKSGYYEWRIKIIKCEGSAQEIGIVSNPNIDNINIKQNEGIMETKQFGARAIYGNRLESIYYASYNDNDQERCYKDLSDQKNKHKTMCWSKSDIIKICLDLNKYRIKFYLNDKKVRKKISIQSNKTYYPIISFIGDFTYQLIL